MDGESAVSILPEPAFAFVGNSRGTSQIASSPWFRERSNERSCEMCSSKRKWARSGAGGVVV